MHGLVRCENAVVPLSSHLREVVRVSFLEDPDPEGQGFCQAGFSVDFTKVRFSLSPLPHISSLTEDKHRSLLRREASFGDL